MAIQVIAKQIPIDYSGAIALKANIESPSLTGTPLAPTAALGTNTTQIATMAALKAAIDALIDSSPTTLDTLKELSAALGNDADFASHLTTNLGLKAPLDSAALTGTPTAPTAATTTNTTQLATCAFVQQELSAKIGSEVLSAVSMTLSAAHNNCRVTITATGKTVTIPDAATLGFFECEIQADGYSVTLDGPGLTNVTLENGEICSVFTSNGKVRIVKGTSTIIT